MYWVKEGREAMLFRIRGVWVTVLQTSRRNQEIAHAHQELIRHIRQMLHEAVPSATASQ